MFANITSLLRILYSIFSTLMHSQVFRDVMANKQTKNALIRNMFLANVFCLIKLKMYAYYKIHYFIQLEIYFQINLHSLKNRHKLFLMYIILSLIINQLQIQKTCCFEMIFFKLFIRLNIGGVV